ncbi:MAG TPA: L-serine ammonia-lyase, iron-sulfur-dependent, subunit alpha [bacterium]|nr:L-serine ammonia-lyase, iron-sulfur-dependent, subunit alpha [bacterium]
MNYSITTAANLMTFCKKEKISVTDLIIDIEASDRGLKQEDIRKEMERRIEIMKSSITEGLAISERSATTLSGGDSKLLKNSKKKLLGDNLYRAVTYAYAIMETNARSGKIVACPTAGSSGVVPAALISTHEINNLSNDRLVDAFFIAALVGIIIAQNAMISGAKGGCQAEVGTASAMAAAGLVSMFSEDPQDYFDGAAIALKGLLGLICDPVAGLVECPCVKRNGTAVANAFTSAEVILAGVRSNIPFDEVVEALKEVGLRMHSDFRETACGGVANTRTGKSIWNLICKL